MQITFATTRMHKMCNSAAKLRGEWGPTMAKIIQRRLDDLAAAANLEVMRTLPGRCHQLRGNLNGHFAVHLERPGSNTCFVPTNDPLPVDASGRLDWGKVTMIEIVGIGDYHNYGRNT